MTDVKVEQCDWEKAKRYRGQLGHWTLGDRSMFETLAEDFARHRQAAEKAQQERDAKVAQERADAYHAIPRVNLLNAARAGEAERIATAIRSQGHE